MKKINYFLLITALFVLSFSSCKKDNDDNSGFQNELSFDGSTYTLAKAFLESYGSNDDQNTSYDFDVTLTSDQISLDSGGDFVGSGVLLYLDLNTTSATGFVDGTYTFAEERGPFTLVDGGFATSINSGTSGELTIFVTSGTVEISVDGAQTEFDFNLGLANGQTVEGNFKGQLQ